MSDEKQYQNALDYLYSFIDYSLTHQAHLSLNDSDLSRMCALMQTLGNPQNDYPSIHVAGSKGKGSVSAFCATALQNEGYRVGLYTSPHLKDFEERIQINREPISRNDLVEFVDEIKPHVSAIPRLNTFEIITAIAFWYFSRRRVDIAVIEVGLGGRLDATNVITPKVSVITALFLEHTNILGETITKIAREKAGIIKPGVPIVTSPLGIEARKTVEAIAAQRKASLIKMGSDYSFRKLKSSFDLQTFELKSLKTGELTNLDIRLLGQHQVENAATAYVALQQVRKQGVPISEKAIHDGFANTEWPARFEILRQDPPVVVDSAHNPDSARKLRQTIEEYFPNRPIVIIFGVSEDKNIVGMVNELLPGTIQFICSQSTHPRAMEANALMNLVKPFGIPVIALDNVRGALEYALNIGGENAVVLVTGSIFVAATARIAWFENMKINVSSQQAF